MAKKRKIKEKNNNNMLIGQGNRILPTPERVRLGGLVLRDNIVRDEEPLRIDKLLKNGIIDDMQHHYGLQIITLWTIARRPFLKSANFERIEGGRFDSDRVNVSRMHAEDQFYKTMAQLSARDYGLIQRICFEEEAAIAAGRAMGLPVNAITIYLRDAFDALGNALAETRRQKKTMEKAAETSDA